jgi:hypothetical protein
MTVKIDLKPDVHAGLLAQAQARGLDLEAYLQQVLQERSRSVASGAVGAAEKAKAFIAWAQSHPSAQTVVEDTYRRETLIRDAQ